MHSWRVEVAHLIIFGPEGDMRGAVYRQKKGVYICKDSRKQKYHYKFEVRIGRNKFLGIG